MRYGPIDPPFSAARPVFPLLAVDAQHQQRMVRRQIIGRIIGPVMVVADGDDHIRRLAQDLSQRRKRHSADLRLAVKIGIVTDV